MPQAALALPFGCEQLAFMANQSVKLALQGSLSGVMLGVRERLVGVQASQKLAFLKKRNVK
jgi:hypothetical protein